MNKPAFTPVNSATAWPAVSSAAQLSTAASPTPVFGPPQPGPTSNFITTHDFAALYAAAEFSLENGYPLASHLIINWTILGFNNDNDVARAFLAFTKRLRDYLTRRGVPPLWIYAHERGSTKGWHTHIAIFLPVEVAELRTDFVEWFRTLPFHIVGRRVPRAVRMRIAQGHDEKLHWLHFNYLTKTYDPVAIVQSAKHAPGGDTIRLGDLIAFPRRDPGITTTRKRFGFSQNLGPSEQAKGIPAKWSCMRKSDVVFRLTADSPRSTLSPSAGVPFRSTFDDACYDPRQLYGAEFPEWKQRQLWTSAIDAVNDTSPDLEDIFGGYI